MAAQSTLSIEKYMEANALSQEQLAKLIGASQGTISNILGSDRKNRVVIVTHDDGRVEAEETLRRPVGFNRKGAAA